MTQKELSYLEDAIGHEQNIIKICNDISNKLQDEELKTFINNEINTHNTMKQDLINILEAKVNG